MEVSFNFLVALKYFKSYGFPPTALLLLQSGFMDYILLSCMSAWLHLLPYLTNLPADTDSVLHNLLEKWI